MISDHTTGQFLDVALADILSRYPDAAGLLHGSGLALFADEQSLVSGGVTLPVGEALSNRGICPELFQLLLVETIIQQQRPDNDVTH